MKLSLNSNMLPGNYKAKRKKFGIGSLLIMLILGTAFLVAGYFIVSSSKIDASWTRVDGTVTDVRSTQNDGTTMYSPVVSYTVDNQTYKQSSSMSSSSRPTLGSTKQIAYNPTNPSEAKIVQTGLSALWIWIFPLIGVILLCIAPYAFIKSQQRTKAVNNLLQSGTKVQGVITNINTTTSRDSNGGSYSIEVSAPDTQGQVRQYTSDSVTGLGSLTMADFRNNPIPIDVYIDPRNSENYYVDISDIPNLTPERIAALIKTATGVVISQPVPGITQNPTSNPINATPLPPQQPPVQPQDPNATQQPNTLNQ